MANLDLKLQVPEVVRRQDWTISMSPSDLGDACERKVTYHEARLAHWESELEKARRAESRSKRIQDIQVTGGVQRQIVFDQAKTSRRVLCEGKVKSHKESAEEFRGWRAFFRVGTHSYHLTHSDVIYFGIGDSADT